VALVSRERHLTGVFESAVSNRYTWDCIRRRI